MGSDPGRLLDHARAALRRLAEAPHVVEAALAAEAELDRMWTRQPWSIGLTGDPRARTTVVNTLCGEPVFDPDTRPAGSAALRLTHGAEMVYRAVGPDDREVTGTLRTALPPPVKRELELATARAEVEQQRAVVAAAEQHVPAIVRAERLAWWRLPLRWLTRLVRRGAVAAWDAARAALAQRQQQLALVEGTQVRDDESWRRKRDEELGPLRELAARRDMREIALVVDGMLPAHVELVELIGTARSEAEVDAVLIAAGGVFYAPAHGDSASLRVGEVGEVLPQLPEVARQARALRLALRARDRLRSGRAAIDEALASAELSFRARIERLEAMRIADPVAFISDALARMHPQVFTSVAAILEHASVHLGSELAELAKAAIESIAKATDGDQLKAAAARIDETWEATTRRIAEEVRVLVMGGAGGSAHDLVLELLRLLVPHGLPEQELRTRRARPELAPVDVLPGIMRPKDATLWGKGQWLAGLFQSFEARKTKVRERAHDTIERLKQVATAELLELEPRLHAAIREAVERELVAAVGRQQAALEGAIAAEQAAIAREREALAQDEQVRARVVADLAELERAIVEFGREHEAVAAAAVAAVSASAVFRL